MLTRPSHLLLIFLSIFYDQISVETINQRHFDNESSLYTLNCRSSLVKLQAINANQTKTVHFANIMLIE